MNFQFTIFKFETKAFLFSLVLLLTFTFSLLTAPPALAHCPLCVAGAATGLTLTRWVGIDDSIAGVWIAALLGATSFWTYLAVSKKKRLPFAKPLIYILLFAATLWSFYKFRLIIRMDQIFGLDKLTFGMVAGGILFYLVDILDDIVIKRKGKVLFPYQRMIVSLGSMVILSLAIYILINFFI